MKWVFAGFITLFLVVFQTVLLPGLSASFYCFDLTIILVVFFSLYFSHYLTLAAIAVIGAIMDSLSGAPFFIYTFSYTWIFLMVQLVRQLVFQTNTLFVMVIGLLSVAIQQALFLFSIIVRQHFSEVGSVEISLVFGQMAWGGVMVPLGVKIISKGNRWWQDMIRRKVKNREQKRTQAHG
jgi:rod shape-determining protein MreD